MRTRSVKLVVEINPRFQSSVLSASGLTFGEDGSDQMKLEGQSWHAV